jgi:hypothetical protein
MILNKEYPLKRTKTLGFMRFMTSYLRQKKGYFYPLNTMEANLQWKFKRIYVFNQ